MSSPHVDSITISDVDEVIRSYLMDQTDILIMPSVPPSQRHSNAPYVGIVEQPASRNLRFRYECEGRSAGSIVGVNSTPENRTHPTIQVMNYQGPFVVVVSAVTKEGPPYKPHPHNLVGREGCKNGFCTLVVNNPDMTYSFSSLGIQCVKRKDIEKNLKQREKYKVDPFGTGFGHQTQPGSIDLNVVRLCFQVFIKGPNNTYSQPLPPVVSESIFDKKAMSDLTITKLSHYATPVCGGTEVILLCDRVAKEDIQVWFYEEQGTMVTWECQAEFQPSDVHKQVAIAFRTPRYYNENIQQPVQVFVELRRPSDNLRGDARPFQFLPMERDPERLTRKRLKTEENCYKQFMQANIPGVQIAQERQAPIAVPRMVRQPTRQRMVKVEPAPGPGGVEPYSNVSMMPIQPPPQYSPNMSNISVNVPPTQEVPSAHLTPAHSPAMAMSPGACSYASSVSPPAPMGMAPIMPVYAPQAISPAAQSPLGEGYDCSSPHQPLTNTNTLDESIIENFGSLGLVIDSKELTDFNVNLNLSTSLFDSIDNTNHLMDNAMQNANQDQNMPSDDGLNQITRIQNQLEQLCQDTQRG